uniref:Cytochrome P450 n=1 Tax=Sinopodophyllum hexandrum TaxID=93608 RepID=A0A0N9HTC9_SINHE|nr:cytochrome P450 [Sinopodophyllum hexandrum]
MELILLVLFTIISLATLFLLFTPSRIKPKPNAGSRKLPPGPPGWPLFGNMFDLGSMPNESLANLSKKYGPVLWLRLGLMNIVVISSAEVAMEMFRYHDLNFANRNITEAMRVHSFHQGAITVMSYGPHWRMLRRISTMELFSNRRINNSQNLRQKCVDNMIKWISNESMEKGVVEISQFISLMNFNVIGNLMLSRDLVDPSSIRAAEFFTAAEKVVQCLVTPNMADLFPFLWWLDPQGIKKKMKQCLGKALQVATGFVKERIVQKESKTEESKNKDFLDVLLEFQGNQKDGEPATISETNINILMLELFTAATDTITSTMEWAITELLRNPSTMKKVEDELEHIVGKNKKVEEGDIEKLHFLQAVVKETLRLHPPVPLLIPRRSMEDRELMGYSIPKNTQVLVNVWAMGRDPSSWDDPLVFKPERFLGSDIDYKGQHFQLLPFGSGRRMCVGLPLAHRVLHFALASLIQSFEWALEEGVKPEGMDMTGTFGALRKAQPLKVVVQPRTNL